MRSACVRLKEWLFGRIPSRTVTPRKVGATLLKKLSEDGDGIRALTDSELMDLVTYLLTNRSLRRPLYGSTDFMSSVAAQYRKKGRISAKQRKGVLNVLERAYPHNLAAELRRKG